MPRIAIIGAGLGGLSLLVHLQRLSIPATIYERDSSLEVRSHLGGTLDLHYESGQRALNKAGIKWKHLSRPEGEEVRIYDSKGNLLFEEGAQFGGLEIFSRPEIDRTVLRKLLHDAVEPSSVKWSHTLLAAIRLPDSSIELTFANSSIVICDLLIGADGAWSRVRPLVSQHKPTFAGVTGAELSLAPELAASPEMQELSERVGQGIAFALHKGKTITLQRNGDGRIRIYVIFHDDESFALPSDLVSARAALIERFSTWAPWMLKSITECDPEAIYPRLLHVLPVDHRWETQGDVTLLGDAAHLMSPFAGAGANLALLDGLQLAMTISAASKRTWFEGEKADRWWHGAIEKYEHAMFRRAQPFAQESADNLKIFLGEGTPDTVVELMKSHSLARAIQITKNCLTVGAPLVVASIVYYFAS